MNRIATKLFDDGNVIKYVYHQEVVEVIKQYNSQLKNECLQLANFILPKIQDVLQSQRKSYGIGNTSSDFPIGLQAKNINDVPVHNLNMENYCGKDSWLIEKYEDVNAASRSKIIKGTNQLLNKNSYSIAFSHLI